MKETEPEHSVTSLTKDGLKPHFLLSFKENSCPGTQTHFQVQVVQLK